MATDVTEGGEENGEEEKGSGGQNKGSGRKGEKSRREWRSESNGRRACRGYCDGNVIRKSDFGALGSVLVTPSASNLS